MICKHDNDFKAGFFSRQVQLRSLVGAYMEDFCFGSEHNQKSRSQVIIERILQEVKAIVWFLCPGYSRGSDAGS